MIKTLRITGVIAVVLAAIFVALPAVFGASGDKEIEEFLNSPGAIEEFKNLKGQKASRGKSQTSPLVEQARKFALYLNPPEREKKKAIVSRKTPKRPAAPSPLGAVSAKFELIGTSYYASHPELSLALIDQPGKGLQWVRQSSKVGHLIIEQIKDGLVVVRDGQTTQQLVPRRLPKISLIKGESSGTVAPKSAVPSVFDESVLEKPPLDKAIEKEKPVSAKSIPVKPGAEITSGTPPWAVDGRDKASVENFLAEIKAMQPDIKPGVFGPKAGDREKMARMEKLISEFRATHVNSVEAKKLGQLGKDLKDVGDDPNQGGGLKIERPKRKQPPRMTRPQKKATRK